MAAMHGGTPVRRHAWSGRHHVRGAWRVGSWRERAPMRWGAHIMRWRAVHWMMVMVGRMIAATPLFAFSSDLLPPSSSSSLVQRASVFLVPLSLSSLQLLQLLLAHGLLLFQRWKLCFELFPRTFRRTVAIFRLWRRRRQRFVPRVGMLHFILDFILFLLSSSSRPPRKKTKRPPL